MNTVSIFVTLMSMIIGEALLTQRDLACIIKDNNKIKKIFDILQNEIVPRFQTFSNFEQCSVGFDGDVIRICFDMPEE